MITEGNGIYIWKFANGKGYIGQAVNVHQRLHDEIRHAFLPSKEYDTLRSENIRRHGLQSVQLATIDGDTFGVEPKLFEAFRTAMVGNLTNLDIAEILYILKSYELGLGYESLNTQMGGQHNIQYILQSNGVQVPSLLSRQSTPQEAYNRFAVADVRQANINEFTERFYNAIFSENWKEFWSYINSQGKTLNYRNPTMAEQSWNEFVTQNVITRIHLWAQDGNEMKNVQSLLTEWVEDKMLAICAFLPGYLELDKKTLNADARRDFAWASRNIYAELKDFDSDISKLLREQLHKIIGSVLTAGKYEYSGTTGRGGLAKYLQKAFFDQLNKNTDKIKDAIKDALISQIKYRLQNALLKTIRISNNKLKADSTWWGLFKAWNPFAGLQFSNEETFFKTETQLIFNTMVTNVLNRRNILNRIEPEQYTCISDDLSMTNSSHSRHYKADNNAIRMNWLDSGDQLYTAVREKYKDTCFYHAWFEFYRPLISNWRMAKYGDQAAFQTIDVMHQSDGEEVGERSWIGNPHGEPYIFLYRCARLMQINDITVY